MTVEYSFLTVCRISMSRYCDCAPDYGCISPEEHLRRQAAVAAEKLLFKPDHNGQIPLMLPKDMEGTAEQWWKDPNSLRFRDGVPVSFFLYLVSQKYSQEEPFGPLDKYEFSGSIDETKFMTNLMDLVVWFEKGTVPMNQKYHDYFGKFVKMYLEWKQTRNDIFAPFVIESTT